MTENTVISKNVNLSKANAEVAGKLNVTGSYLVCGEIGNQKMLNVSDGEIVYIDEETFNRMLTSSVVTFDAAGGTVAEAQKTVYYEQAYGTLPMPERDKHTFLGWFTEETGGKQVTEETVVSALVNQTLYAHWGKNTYTLTFDANKGTVSEASREASCGDEIGTLPVPNRDYYTFDGWYTAETDGEKVTEKTAFDTDMTIYAHWTQNSVSDWVKADEMPSDAQVIDTKWTYTLREYKESASSSLSGYTKYDTKRTSWGSTQGPVYSDPSNGSRNVWSESYETSRTTHWVYYRYANSSYTAGSNSCWGNYTNYEEIDLTYQLSHDGNSATSSAVTYYKSNGKYSSYWYSRSYDDVQYGTRWYYQDPVYTYYYYRDVSKEATSDPTGQSNVSNVVKYVKYRAK